MNQIDYGYDAPTVARNLLLFGWLALAALPLSWLITSTVWFWGVFIYVGCVALSLIGAAIWLIYSSRVLKPRIIKQMLNRLNLRGDEALLDLGCGRGIVLIEAARQLPKGKTYGIDLWKSEDQSGNSLEATLRNIATAKLTDRISVSTADMLSLPFPDAYFDVVVSSLAIHNIPNQTDRERALGEMLRVLKPGGSLALFDISYTKQYLIFLKSMEGVEAHTVKTGHWYCPPASIIQGRKR